MRPTLDDIVANTRQEVAKREAQLPFAQIVAQLTPGFRSQFIRALKQPGLNLILEVKPSSPSAGVLSENINLETLLAIYSQHAAALSILTDARYFNGSFQNLNQAARLSPCPTLCKDFIISPYQLAEARLNGAHAALLIVKILSQKDLHDLFSQALQLGLTPVVEVQTEAELKTALALSPPVILINNRNLSDFTIDFETTKRLAPMIPSETVIISASGIETRADIDALHPYTSTFLIGSSLMRLPLEQLPQHLEALTCP